MSYVLPSGGVPVEDFLEELARSDPASYAHFYDVLLPQIQEFGPGVGEPLIKRLSAKAMLEIKGFLEIRWRSEGHANYRIYGSIETNNRIVGYRAVDKRWREMTAKDKQICKTRYRDYHSKTYNASDRQKVGG